MPYADPKSEAAKNSRRRAGKKYYDANREAQIAAAKAWNAANRDRFNAAAAARRVRAPANLVLWRNARNRAIANGLAFDLRPEDLFVPDKCPVLGITLAVQTRHAGPNSPSVDRIDPTGGYVRGNVRVISHKANTIKSNATADELRAVLAYVEAMK